MFSEETKNKFKEFGKEKEYKEIELIYMKHKKRFIHRLEPLRIPLKSATCSGAFRPPIPE